MRLTREQLDDYLRGHAVIAQSGYPLPPEAFEMKAMVDEILEHRARQSSLSLSASVDINTVALEVVIELERAVSKHGPMKSAHEAYAVILEELDELWTEIKRQTVNGAACRKEALHVAAMAMRFVLDVVDPPS